MPSAAERWLPDHDTPLFLLAMDQRASFAKDNFGVAGIPGADDIERMRTAKSVIYEGLRRVTLEGPGRLGVLVDEELGTAVATAARKDGVVLAMPVERSGSRIFELDYGDNFANHVVHFDPDFFKVLVRSNPVDPAATRDTQISRLQVVSAWAEREGRPWLFELLVPPTPAQLADHGGQEGYDRDGRPGLTANVVQGLTSAGVHPTIWKLEGYETSAGAELVVETLTRASDEPVRCIVLGRNAPLPQVQRWLQVAAAQPSFVGFAIGRSIWERPLQDFLGQRIGRDELVEQVADTYALLIRTYTAGSGQP
jgi:myo-inositol catabolism protein IolC